VYICDICVSIRLDIIRNSMSSFTARKGPRGTLTPTRIKEALDDYVIGQEMPRRPRVAATTLQAIDARDPVYDGTTSKSKKRTYSLSADRAGKTLLAQRWRGYSMCRSPSRTPRL